MAETQKESSQSVEAINSLSTEQSAQLKKANTNYTSALKLLAEGKISAGRQLLEKATYQYELVLKEPTSPEQTKSIRIIRAQGFEQLAKTAVMESRTEQLLKTPVPTLNKGELLNELKSVEQRINKFYGLAVAELTAAAKSTPEGSRELYRVAQELSKYNTATKSAVFEYAANAIKAGLGESSARIQAQIEANNKRSVSLANEQNSQNLIDKGFSLLTGTNQLYQQQHLDLSADNKVFQSRVSELNALSKQLVSALRADTNSQARLSRIKDNLDSILSKDLRAFSGAQYQGLSNSYAHYSELDKQVDSRMDKQSRILTTGRNAALTAGVTTMTAGIGGAAIAAGYGTASVLAGSTLGGTVGGTVLSGATKVVANEIRTATGESRGKVYDGYGHELIEDTKTSATAALVTATGLGSAKILTGSRAAVAGGISNGQKLQIAVQSGVASGTVQTGVSLGRQIYGATQEFLKDPKFANLKDEKRLEAYTNYLSERGISTVEVSKEFLKGMLLGGLGSAVGITAQIGRDASRSVITKSLVSGAELSVSTSIGISSATISNGEITVESVTQESTNLLLAAMRARAVAKSVEQKQLPIVDPKRQQTSPHEVAEPVSAITQVIERSGNPSANGRFQVGAIDPMKGKGPTTDAFNLAQNINYKFEPPETSDTKGDVRLTNQPVLNQDAPDPANIEGAHVLRLPVRNQLRNTQQTKVSPEYLEANQKAVKKLAEKFDNRDSSPISVEEFRKLQDEIHAAGVYHNKSDNPGVARTRTLFVKGGMFRRDMPLVSRRPAAADYVERVFSEHGARLNLGKIEEAIDIEGIPKEMRPTNIYGSGRGRGTHYYPTGLALEKYFERGAELYNDIRRIAISRGDTDRAKELIGDYLHVMTNARPYDQVNNSIYMAQANFMLQALGHSGIPHHHLDHLFQRVNSAQARQLWRLALNGELKAAHEYGIQL